MDSSPLQSLPEYRVQETSHAQERFIAEVWLRGQQLGQERDAQSAAEQAAAQMAFFSAHDQGVLRRGVESREGMSVLVNVR